MVNPFVVVSERCHSCYSHCWDLVLLAIWGVYVAYSKKHFLLDLIPPPKKKSASM